MQIKANGISINYAIDGSARRRDERCPWLVLSNSLATDSTMWDQQAKDFAVVVPRAALRPARPRQDRSAGGRYTFDMLIADALAPDGCAEDRARAFLRPLDGRRDRAGPRAAPSRSRRSRDRVRTRAAPRRRKARSNGKSASRSRRRAGWSRWSSRPSTRWFPPDVVAKNPPYLDTVRAMVRNTPVNGFIGCAAALADHDFRSAVAATKPPVLFIAGEKDAGGAVPDRDEGPASGAAGLALRRASRCRAHLQSG